jgi:EpsI family protein
VTDENRNAGPVLTRRKFALGLAFAGAAGAAAAKQPNQRLDYLGKAKLDELLPEKLGSWSYVSSSGLVIPPEDQLSRALYSQLLTRVYASPENLPMMLLIAQSGSQTGILQVHRPEICYTAGGYQLSNVQPHPVALPGRIIPAMSLTARSDNRIEQLLYWTRIGNHLPTSWRQQRLAVAMDNLRGMIPDAAMVRVSTISPDRDAAVAAMDSFISTMMQSISPELRRVLIS